MATTNIKRWDEAAANMQSDGVYAVEVMRTGGAASGVFPSVIFNKLLYQMAAFAAAFAEMMVAKGYTVEDGSAGTAGHDFTALKTALANVMTHADTLLKANLNAQIAYRDDINEFIDHQFIRNGAWIKMTGDSDQITGFWDNAITFCKGYVGYVATLTNPGMAIYNGYANSVFAICNDGAIRYSNLIIDSAGKMTGGIVPLARMGNVIASGSMLVLNNLLGAVTLANDNNVHRFYQYSVHSNGTADTYQTAGGPSLIGGGFFNGLHVNIFRDDAGTTALQVLSYGGIGNKTAYYKVYELIES